MGRKFSSVSPLLMDDVTKLSPEQALSDSLCQSMCQWDPESQLTASDVPQP